MRGRPVQHDQPGGETDKRTLRREFLGVRNRLTTHVVGESAAALAGHALRLPELARARTVAAYVSVGTEPGTRALLDALLSRGVRVLLPALL
ncbi:5-formyltetrahydrofolate cyclo-ligase, partial [Streptomyces gramineus]